MEKRGQFPIFTTIIVLILLFLITGFVSAQDSGAPPGVTPVGGNPAALPSATDEGGTGAAEAEKLDPKEIQKEPVGVGDYFGYEDPNRVKVQGLAGEGQDQTITVEQLEGDKRKVSGIGDFSVTFYDKEGKETNIRDS